MTRTRSIKAHDEEWDRWARAAGSSSFNGWARRMLNAAADAALAEIARREDELRQRELLREAIRQ